MKKKFDRDELDAERAKILNESAPFTVQEAYKTLRTNVQFSLAGKGAKCIAVTSATQGIGKSTNLINLAISFAQINKKVIVVDCDLRLPSVVRKLNLGSEIGLSNIVIGEVRLEQAIQRVPQYGIDVLPAGKVPPDATRLLESEEFSEVFNSLMEKYDYVLIDLPPVLAAADATILAKKVDGYLLIVRHNTSKNKEVREMINRLKFAKANILGVVYTGTDNEKKSGYYKYYSSNQ